MFHWILKLRWAVGLIAVAICAWAWWVELSGIAYVCPFCRVQRTVIGILGLIMLLPAYGHWAVRYIAAVLGFFGSVVASNQHFGGWARISAGEFEFYETLYLDPFLLSGAALFIIIALVGLLWVGKPGEGRTVTGPS
ncbi:alkaline shock response membrane anchor protein AmaP [Maricaulaceae bacterium NA33B04]|nr:alkaline shock response membrane anchor protein AmaP [Maricaulaceae bacterium NA33B04]